MNTSPTEYQGLSPSGNLGQYGISHTRADNTTNNFHSNSNMNVGNVSNSYNSIINVGGNEEFLQIQEWLSPLEPHRRHQDVRNRRLDGVGDWVLRRNEYKSWRKNQDGPQDPTLRCYGGQGVGKTYISSLVIDTLRDEAHGQNISVLSLYCDYQAQKDQSAVNMIGSLLKQVVAGAAGVPGEIKSAFKESKKGGGQGLRLPDMVKLLIQTISSIERVYICVDALDELLPQDRSEFLRALRQIIQAAPTVRLFLTARHHINVELDKHLARGAYIIRIVADQGDIARYISRKMDDDDARDPDLMTENLKNDIIETMLEKTSEMFLLVALNIDAILGEISLAKRRKMLQKVATTGVDLDSVYALTLHRIRDQKGSRSRLGMEVLMWVSHAKRPLRIDELCLALAVEIVSTDLDPENISPPDTVLGSCLGLVAVDKETSTVRLIHYTLQEYLSHSGNLPDAHKILAQTCLAYLNHEQVKKLPANNVPNLRDMPFLEYSSFYWGSHAKAEPSDHTKSLALSLLSRYDNHVSATLLFRRTQSYLPTRSLFTGLHCASYFGIVEIVAALIEMKGCDINQGDCTGSTALMWAARQGNEGVVRLLLARGDADPDKSDIDGQTPLARASYDGHEGVVKLLLARGDVDPNKPDDIGRTPLVWASHFRHEGVVELLLARGDVDPDKPDNAGDTPLIWASYFGYEGVVKLLLARGDVDPNKPDNSSRTPLVWASCQGNEGAVKLLLARGDVDPDKPDKNGQTPLWQASCYGHEGVARLLLARDDVNPDKPDKSGQTPLMIASERSHTQIVALLQPRTTPPSSTN